MGMSNLPQEVEPVHKMNLTETQNGLLWLLISITGIVKPIDSFTVAVLSSKIALMYRFDDSAYCQAQVLKGEALNKKALMTAVSQQFDVYGPKKLLRAEALLYEVYRFILKHVGSNQYSLPHSHINAGRNHGKNSIDYIVTEEDYLAVKRTLELLELEKLLNDSCFTIIGRSNNEGEESVNDPNLNTMTHGSDSLQKNPTILQKIIESLLETQRSSTN